MDPDTCREIAEITLLAGFPVEQLHACQVGHVLAANDQVPFRLFA
jgi:hypothetical protein